MKGKSRGRLRALGTGRTPWWAWPASAWLPVMLMPHVAVALGLARPDNPMATIWGSVGLATILTLQNLWIAWRMKKRWERECAE